MPKLVTVKADEKAVLISNEKPVKLLNSGRHMIWVDIWKRIEFFPRAQQTIKINNISVQLSQMASDSFKQNKTRGNFVAEAQIDITFYFEFANDIDLFATVRYAPKGAGSISDRISNLTREEIMAKVASFSSQRTWNEALWTRENFQKDLNENIKKDGSLAINQLKLNNCRVVITRLNLPPEFKIIAKYKVEAEGRHIKVDNVTEIMKEFKEKFSLSKNTENLVFLLAMSGEDISGILSNTKMNFVIAPFIESLMNSLTGGTENEQEKALNRLLMQAESHPEEVNKIVDMIKQ